MHKFLRASAVAAAAAIGLSASVVAPASAEATDAIACVSLGNVWVVVQDDTGTSGGCATEFATGLQALESAGFTAVAPGGFVSTIDGQPATAGAEDWWSYWNNVPGDDGAYAGWESYMVGAASSAPVPGSVEGWRLWHSWSINAEAPTTDPVADFTLGTPVFLIDPADATVPVNGTATLSVDIAGSEDTTIEWYVVTGDGDGSLIEGATEPDLVIDWEAGLGEVMIAALATNSIGETWSEVAYVTYEAAPEVAPTPAPTTVTPGLPSTGN